MTGKTPNAPLVETLEHVEPSSSLVVHDDLEWFVGKGSGNESDLDAAQAWLDALPAELA